MLYSRFCIKKMGIPLTLIILQQLDTIEFVCFIEFFFEICYTKSIKTEATSPINRVMRFVGLFLFSGEMGMRDFGSIINVGV
jgi:hypothetical protein